MAKNLEKVPSQFQELAEALRGGERSGWSVGSAEGGWATPSEEEWGKQAEEESPPPPRRSRAARRARAIKRSKG